eukprot:m.224234 g.224234  ORF g.224234 m.224234 type:complete len:91 (+) comp33424_c2_seq2:2670-2942(+)
MRRMEKITRGFFWSQNSTWRNDAQTATREVAIKARSTQAVRIHTHHTSQHHTSQPKRFTFTSVSHSHHFLRTDFARVFQCDGVSASPAIF